MEWEKPRKRADWEDERHRGSFLAVCRHCGRSIDVHPEDHKDGCEAKR